MEVADRRDGKVYTAFQVGRKHEAPGELDVTVVDGQLHYARTPEGVMLYAPGNWFIMMEDGPYYTGTLEPFFDIVPEKPPAPVSFVVVPLVDTDTPLQFVDESLYPGARRLFTFAPGKGQPLHVHTKLTNHLTYVDQGSLVCTGRPSIEGKIIGAKQAVLWVAGEPHGFFAGADGAQGWQVSV
jgi:hypothetical protein